MRYSLPSFERRGVGLGALPRLADEADIADDDFTIQDARAGGYEVFQAGRRVGRPSSIETALEMVRARMERERFYPNIWYVNDRGNTDLIDSRGNIIASWV